MNDSGAPTSDKGPVESRGLLDADVETASADYARRFAGPLGAWMLERQSGLVLELLRDWHGATVLDVGGGHGQVALPLAGVGSHVLVYGSSPDACTETVREDAAHGRLRFESGDLLHAPWPDRSFDVVVCVRLLAHAPDSDALLAELCRVARHAVLVDYPTRRSVNAFADAFFGLKRRVEKNTRPFRTFSEGEIRRGFDAHGFQVAARRAEFLFPMALHRAVGSTPLSRAAESLARGLALTRLLGSPVIVRAERRAD